MKSRPKTTNKLYVARTKLLKMGIFELIFLRFYLATALPGLD
jgi:hypothetical protein